MRSTLFPHFSVFFSFFFFPLVHLVLEEVEHERNALLREAISCPGT